MPSSLDEEMKMNTLLSLEKIKRTQKNTPQESIVKEILGEHGYLSDAEELEQIGKTHIRVSLCATAYEIIFNPSVRHWLRPFKA